MASTEALSKSADLLIHDYTPALNLSPVQGAQLSRYINLWDILRMCCGAQMSTAYRETLWLKKTGGGGGGGGGGAPAHECERHDLDAVEKEMLQTDVFTSCGQIDLIGRLSDNDGRLTGSYCSEARKQTIQNELAFNDARYLEIDKRPG